MDFLKYIEHSAENLQFYLWFKDYVQRFEALPQSERSLSPEWTEAQEEAEKISYRAQLKQKPLAVEANEILKAQSLLAEKETPVHEKHDPFTDVRDVSSRGSGFGDSFSGSMDRTETGYQSTKSGFSRGAEAAFEDAGCKFQPCKISALL
jgi:hypothetical protein